MGRKQRAGVGADAADQVHHLLVLAHGEAQAAVLLGNLHAEGAELAEAVDHLVLVFAGYVDLDRVELVAKQIVDRLVERHELGVFFVLFGIGVDEIEPEVAKEHLFHERRLFPSGLPRFLRDLASLFFGNVLTALFTHRCTCAFPDQLSLELP
jgi:hypothetical protein